MIESASHLGQEQGRFAVSRFIPLIDFENILENAPKEGIDRYLNNNLRILLSGWGISFDLPWFYRPVDHVFRRTLVRRAAVSVGLQSDKARLVVIETASMHKNVLPAQPLPDDPYNADIRIWLLEKQRKRGQDKPWRLELSDLYSIMETTIALRKFGRSEVVEVYNGEDSGLEDDDGALQILKHWCGLR